MAQPYAAGRDSLYGSSPSRGDFCNSFWGPGNDGVNILLSRMRGATKTTEELRLFWNERALIEEQYATRLAALAKFALGGEEIGELRASLDTLRLETEKQAATHAQLASTIHTQIEHQASLMYARQVQHNRGAQAAVEKAFKNKQSQESYVAKAKEKYVGDCMRIESYAQQIASAGAGAGVQGKDLERLHMKLARAQQTVQANERDYANFSRALQELLPVWEVDWKEFCDACQDLEEERLDFMKDNMWAYANEVSSVCVSDDISCEAIRTVLDQFEVERDVAHFVEGYGTGNVISDPAAFIPYNTRDGAVPPEPIPITRPANFTRVSRRVLPEDEMRHLSLVQEPPSPISPGGQMWQQDPRPQQQQQQQQQQQPAYQDRGGGAVNGSLGAPPPMDPPPVPQSQSQSQPQYVPPPPVTQHQSQPQYAPPPVTQSQPQYAPPPVTQSQSRDNRVSVPLPTPVNNRYQEQPPMPTPPPPPPPPAPSQETGGILFYVKALYDYTATLDEEFDFQAGDVIAVTATPEDGWWSGELLDEARREEGRHVFPSNFVCLF
ncbi:hypothetical protein H0H81_010465 [Sphagnurus paluster]|uniref:SH3 domain-containing protein n=1 Tax=Sphagnurus paluster TaxID=117069 RepID=A0A9P7GQZ7_9AGAR|nr:hypothetical protein H0H81_010465 [Sphagnurus paluster]